MLGPIPVTNSMLTMFIVMGFLLIVGAAIARAPKQVPGRWQSIFEVVAEFILDLVESTGGKSFGRRIFPMIGGIFIFIVIANYSGLLPGVGTIGVYHTEEAAPKKTTARRWPEHAGGDRNRRRRIRPSRRSMAAH